MAFTAGQLQPIITRYNNIYKSLPSSDTKPTIVDWATLTSLVNDLSTLITAVNTDDALAVAAGYGIAPKALNQLSSTYAAAASVSIDASTAFANKTSATYTASGLPGWLSINSGTGVITGTTPSTSATGPIVSKITVTCTTSYGADSTTVNTTVNF